MAPQFIERLFPQWIWRLPPGQGRIALTFDDGPLPATTPALQKQLSDLHIPSTCFLTGSRCVEHPELVQALYSGGHVLANHGYLHRSIALRRRSAQRSSIETTDRVIQEITGEGCRYYRPPYGHFNFHTRPILTELKYRGVLWSIDARDWIAQSDDELWFRMVQQLHDGAILFLHDGHPKTTPSVIRILPRLAEEVARRGWTFVTLHPSELSTLR
jgi:peptidoglycan/xylan/chitin deacetylase (PgdA/CDA1 family)